MLLMLNVCETHSKETDGEWRKHLACEPNCSYMKDIRIRENSTNHSEIYKDNQSGLIKMGCQLRNVLELLNMFIFK